MYGMVLQICYKNDFMLVPAIALIVILFFVIRFIIGAAKKKQHGEYLGDPGAGNPQPGSGTTHHTRPA